MLFSLFVPCYNSEKTLDKCLDSIKRQTFHDFECIIVDDGSIDSTSVIAQRYVKEDKRFFYYYKNNGGTSDATNYALSLCNGEYIVPVDHDDWISYELLHKLHDFIKSTNCDMIGFQCDLFNNGKRIGCTLCKDSKMQNYANSYYEKLDVFYRKTKMYCTHTSSCFKSSISKGILFDGNGYGADTIFMRSISSKANNIGYLNEVLYHRNVFFNSVSRRKQPLYIDFDILKRLFNHLYLWKNKNNNDCYELYDIYQWFLVGRAKCLKHNLLYLPLVFYWGFKIFFHRKLLINDYNKNIGTYVRLLFPIIPLKSNFKNV